MKRAIILTLLFTGLLIAQNQTVTETAIDSILLLHPEAGPGLVGLFPEYYDREVNKDTLADGVIYAEMNGLELPAYSIKTGSDIHIVVFHEGIQVWKSAADSFICVPSNMQNPLADLEFWKPNVNWSLTKPE